MTARSYDVNEWIWCAMKRWRGSLSWPLRMSVAVFVASLSLGSGPTFAAEDTVRLVTGNNFAPYSDENLPSGGLATDIIRQIFHAAGYKFDIEFMPWKRGYQEVLKHTRDGTFPYSSTQKRRQKFHYSAAIIVVPAYIFAAPSSDFDPTSTEGLNGQTFCRSLGYSIPEPLKLFIDNGSITVVRTPKIENSYRMLIAGRCDIVFWNRDIAAKITKKMTESGLPKLRRLKIGANASKLYFIAAQDHPLGQKLINAVNAGLKLLKTNGRYKNTLERHIGPS